MARTLVIGGTFNPVHVGHLRLAVELRERLGFDRVEWIPCHVPRHKSQAGLLPFALRLALVEAALEGDRGSRVNDIESRLPSPSYSYQTLEALAAAEPDGERHFVLGQDEFLRLHKWYRGREVVTLAHLVVVLRSHGDLGAFSQALEAAWPESRAQAAGEGASAAYELAPGRRARLLAIPRLEVSSSLIRERWLARRSLDHLLPPAVLELLEARRAEVDALWRQGSQLADPESLQ